MTLGGPLDLVITSLVAIRRFGLPRTLWACILLSPVYLWSLPPVSCACVRPFFRRCATVRPHQAWVKADLKNLASQQEIHRIEHGAYSSDRRKLGFVASGGVVVRIYASEHGWGARATHAALEESEGCSIFVGATAPPVLDLDGAVRSGEIACGVEASRRGGGGAP